MGYLFIKGYIYILLIYLCLGGLLSYWGVAFCGYMVGIIFFCFFLGFLGVWDWEFLDFVEESYI